MRLDTKIRFLSAFERTTSPSIRAHRGAYARRAFAPILDTSRNTESLLRFGKSRAISRLWARKKSPFGSPAIRRYDLVSVKELTPRDRDYRRMTRFPLPDAQRRRDNERKRAIASALRYRSYRGRSSATRRNISVCSSQ